MTDPYLDPRNGVLRNLLGITDVATLQDAESRFSTLRDTQIAGSPLPGLYDLAHLQRFHRMLFGDVYPFAGALCTVDISKSRIRFCPAVNISSHAVETVFPRITELDQLRGMDHPSTVAALAEVLTEVNALHPFREGNGRTQRAFFRQMVAAAGWRLDWSGLDPRDNVTACEQAMAGRLDPLTDLLSPRLTRLG